MRSYVLASAAAAALLVGSASQAAVTVQATQITGGPSAAAFLPSSTNAPLYNNDWVGYKLTLVGDAVITAVDFNTGTRGIFASMHQRWGLDPITEEFVPNPDGTLTANTADSHFLAPLDSKLDAVASSEDNSGTGSPLTPSATILPGVGTFLKGAWGIKEPFQTTAYDFAYIVVKASQPTQITVRGQVSEAGTARDIDTVINIPAVPEPASLSLLALGALGLIRRRRA